MGEKRLIQFNVEHVTRLIAFLLEEKQEAETFMDEFNIKDGKEQLDRFIDHFVDDLNFLLKIWTEKFSDHAKPMPADLQAAWATVIYDRFYFLKVQLPNIQDRLFFSKAYSKSYQYALTFTCYFLEITKPLYFSQNVCANHFAAHTSVDKKDFLYAGAKLTEVAEILRRDPTKIDEIPVRVTRLHFSNLSQWVALNNRGFTAINMANCSPLRILPDQASTKEIERFAELGNQPSESITITEEDESKYTVSIPKIRS